MRLARGYMAQILRGGPRQGESVILNAWNFIRLATSAGCPAASSPVRGGILQSINQPEARLVAQSASPLTSPAGEAEDAGIGVPALASGLATGRVR